MSKASIVFPPRCMFCGELLEEKGPACSSCLEAVEHVPKERCKKCSMPYRTPHSLPVCLDCRTDKYTFSKVYAPLLYTGGVKNGLSLFKFRNKRSSALPFARYIFEELEKEGIPDVDILSFVPIDKKRFRERGYNQSKLLADELGKFLSISAVELLRKRRGVKRQSTLSRKQRKKNVRGAFSLLPEADIKGKRILLVDDIYTTGATVGECSRILRRGGAKDVKIAVVALAHLSEFYGRKN